MTSFYCIYYFHFLKVTKRGGIVVPVQCDHEKAEQVKELFERINKDEKGQLDVLVNNAYKGVAVSQFTCFSLSQSFIDLEF